MALPNSLCDREQDKFEEIPETDGQTTVRVGNKNNIKQITVTSNLSVTGHVSADYMETLTFTDFFSRNGGTAWIQDFMIIGSQNISLELTILLFNELPTITSAQSAPINIPRAEFLGGKFQGFMQVNSGSAAFGAATGTIYQLQHIFHQSIPVVAASDSKDLFAVLYYRGSTTYTPGSAGELEYSVKAIRT